MKAIRIHEDGGPEVLRYEDAPDPVAGPDEVLIRLRAESRRLLSAGSAAISATAEAISG